MTKKLPYFYLALSFLITSSLLNAQNIDAGRKQMEDDLFGDAYNTFKIVLKSSPNNTEANFLAAISNLVALKEDDQYHSFLNKYSFSQNGRDFFNWAADVDSDALKKRISTYKNNGTEITQFLRDVILPRIKDSIGHLSKIKQENYIVFLNKNETRISDVFIDHGDTLILKAILEFFQFAIHSINSQNMDLDLNSLIELIDSESSVDQFLDANPNFLSNISDADLKAARTAFIAAINSYLNGADLLKKRKTVNLNHLIAIDESETDNELEFRDYLTHLKIEESLDQLFEIKVLENEISAEIDPLWVLEHAPKDLLDISYLTSEVAKQTSLIKSQVDNDIEKLANPNNPRLISPNFDGVKKADIADLKILRGGLDLMDSINSVLQSHNHNIDTTDIYNKSLNEELNIESVLTSNPQLLTRKQGSDIQKVNTNIRRAYDELIVAKIKASLRRKDDVGIINAGDSRDIDELIKTLDDIILAIDSNSEYEIGGEVVEVNLNPFINNKINLRELLPQFNFNKPIIGTLPDHTFASMLPRSSSKEYIEDLYMKNAGPMAGNVLWQYKASDRTPSNPLINEKLGLIYQMSIDGNFFALNLKTGEKVWERKLVPNTFQPQSTLVSNNIIIMQPSNNRVTCLNAKDGTVLWNKSIDIEKSERNIATYNYANGIIINKQNGIHSIDINNGDLIWEKNLNNKGALISDSSENIYLHSGYNINVLNKFTGVEKGNPFASNLQNNEQYVDFIYASNKYRIATSYIPQRQQWYMSAIDKLNWQTKWRNSIGNSEPSGAVVGNEKNVIFGINADYNLDYDYFVNRPGIYSFNSDTGSFNWFTELAGPIFSSPTISESGKVYVGSIGIRKNGASIIPPFFYCLNESNGKILWEYQTEGSFLSSPAISEDGTIYAGVNGETDGGFKTYAWKGDASLSKSTWPMAGQNPQRTYSVSDRPIIVQQPISQGVLIGEVFKLEVKALGMGPIDYQWFKNGQPIEGETKNTLIKYNISESDWGIYSVRIINPKGKTLSSIAEITEPISPIITKQPESLSFKSGEKVIFKVEVTGTGILDYQWYKDGTKIEGANQSTLTISNADNSHIGEYSVRIKNNAGKAISTLASLKISLEPVLIFKLKEIKSNERVYDLKYTKSAHDTFYVQTSYDLKNWRTIYTDNEIKSNIHLVLTDPNLYNLGQYYRLLKAN